MTKSSLFLGLDESGSFKTTESYQPAILFASAGSGKGVAYMIPNLLHCEDSIICHDIDGENYKLTKKYRESIGQKIYIFNPLCDKTNKYNPFDTIDITDKNKAYNGIEKIAKLLINDTCGCHKKAETRELFINTALDLAQSNASLTFGNILHTVSNNKTSDRETVLMLKNYLEPFKNPLINDATSKSDFDVRNFRKEKSTLYIALQSNEVCRLRPVMNFLYQHFIDLLTNCTHEDAQNDGIRFFLDDFPTLGKMPFLQTMMSYLRGFNIGLFLITSNFSQLESVYKEDTMGIINNTKFRISLGLNDCETADFVTSSSLSEEDLEVQQNKQIIFNANEISIVTDRFNFFDNAEFQAKLQK